MTSILLYPKCDSCDELESNTAVYKMYEKHIMYFSFL